MNARKSQSWGHAIRPLTLAEIASQEEHGRRVKEKYPDFQGSGCSCSMPKCKEPATHVTQYRYVTGRAGRVSYAQKQVCEAHAQKFVAKYRPTHDAADERVNDWIVRAIGGAT